ncbi:gp63 [Alphaproteobacteria phage PhiJL001]|uniref:Gp63 n=1 Tax=Alphaproteobacteria phage PhiJL001 TaxID=2681607 RepID=Q5DN42_9CAUD|nr:gp63 [Alphaproteobacteria phage PhiJL001]AAT69539.1 gp63 [Alphaproteobacteria phage PhiJL001]
MTPFAFFIMLCAVEGDPTSCRPVMSGFGAWRDRAHCEESIRPLVDDIGNRLARQLGPGVVMAYKCEGQQPKGEDT